MKEKKGMAAELWTTGVSASCMHEGKGRQADLGQKLRGEQGVGQRC